MYLQAVEDYHASFASIHWWPREFMEANRDLIRRINLRLGYRLQLVEASWPSEVSLDSTLQFSAKWRNAGVAPCLPGGYPAVTLKDSKGGIVGVFVDEQFDVRSLPVGAAGNAEVLNQEILLIELVTKGMERKPITIVAKLRFGVRPMTVPCMP